MSGQPIIRPFFDEPTNTVSYLVADPVTKKAAVIDPVFDYEHNSGEVDTRSVEAMLKASEEASYEIEWVLEPHAHADHLSGANIDKAKTGAQNGIGEHIKDDQRIFRPIFNATDLKTDGSDFDHQFGDGERFKIGELDVEVLYTPGHTPADVSYKIEDAVFVGDTLFMPDFGTARADFPGGDAHKLYRSIRRLLALSPETRLFMCHDYKAPGRDFYAWETTVREERDNNMRCHRRRCCLCVTITRLPAVTSTPGRQQYEKSARKTSTSKKGSRKMILWPCDRHGTPRCRRQGCCCLLSRSIFVPENSRQPKPMGCVTSPFPSS